MSALASWRKRRQNGAMPSIQIKNVPDETHAVLRRRAAAAGQSLQEYLRTRLVKEAAQPTMQEIFDEGEPYRGDARLDLVTSLIRSDRDSR